MENLDFQAKLELLRALTSLVSFNNSLIQGNYTVSDIASEKIIELLSTL